MGFKKKEPVVEPELPPPELPPPAEPPPDPELTPPVEPPPVEPTPVEPPPPEPEPEPDELVVAPGQGLVTNRGVLGEGAVVVAKDFYHGEVTVLNLIAAGRLVKRPAARST